MRKIKVSSIIKSEHGSVAILNLALLICLLSLFIALFSICDVAVQEHKLQNSADLSALAGAQMLLSAPHEVCNTVRTVAIRNGSLMKSCEFDSMSVTVNLYEQTRSEIVAQFAPIVSQVARAGF